MEFIVDRKYQGYSDNNLLNLMDTSAPECLRLEIFSGFKSTTEALIAILPNYRQFYKATAAGDRTKLQQRKDARKECLRLFNLMADGVNEVAKGDAAIIEQAMMPYRPKNAADRALGETAMKSITYNADTGLIKIVFKKADNAYSYRIDYSTDNKNWVEGFQFATKPIWEFLAPPVTGTVYFRVVPRDSNGTPGTACISKFIKVY